MPFYQKTPLICSDFIRKFTKLLALIECFKGYMYCNEFLKSDHNGRIESNLSFDSR